ncbi:MAG TPA: phage major capsid protein [Gallionella sp.]
MKKITTYLSDHKMQFLFLLVLTIACGFGLIDHTAVIAGGIVLDTELGPEFDILKKALAAHGLSTKEFFDKYDEEKKEMRTRLQDVEQKLAHRPSGGGSGGGNGIAEMASLVMESDGLKAFLKGNSASIQIQIPRTLFKAAIVSATGLGQPLVAPDYRPGINFAPQRRLTIRNLFNAVPTTSDLVVFARENVFTSNAGPQYDASPGTTDGAVKNESAMTFTLANTPVVTLAHWIPASRQVLADAPALQNHLDGRLLYGLKLEEEKELLTGDGSVGTLNGLINQATAFAGGSTNLSPLDALALGIAQLAASEYEPSGIVLNPQDWYSSSILLMKNTLGSYLFGDPGEATLPVLWGLPVVLTNSMPRGKFMVLDAARAGYVVDREEAILRISEQHADFFIRNMVVLLMEERLALVILQGAAIIYGGLTNVG